MMKGFISILLILATTSMSAQAWSNEFQLGFRGGLNFSTVTGDGYDSPDGRTSFYAGLLAEAPLTERLSLQPEVFYARQGFDIGGTPSDPAVEFQLDYIQVPVLLKLYLIDGLNVHAGPQFGFKVNESLDFSPASAGNTIDVDAIQTLDVQLSVGAEYKVLQTFFVQARYAYGFSEIIEDADAHNAVLSLGVGFMF